MSLPGSFFFGLLRTNWLILAVFIALNIVDCWLTQTLMASGWTEANPIWSTFPVWWKMAAAASLVPLVLWRRHVAMAVNAGLALVVLWNGTWFCLELVAGGAA